MAFDSLVTRAEGAAELPHGMANEVITGVMHESVALRLAHTIRTDTRDSRIPVLVNRPSAYWVQGDAGLKSTSKFAFEHTAVIAEELAVVIPVPDNVLSDAEVPLWRQVRPLLTTAFGEALDKAVLWGEGRPASWTSPAVVPDAIAAGNVIAGTDDPAADLLMAAEKVSTSGYVPSGAAVRPGWQYNASARRTMALTSNPVGEQQTYALSIGGLSIVTDPIAWDPDGLTEAIVADWRNIIVAIREDVKIEIFNSGVISDDTGKVVLNLMQQDTSAIRATFRVGTLLAKPATSYGTGGSPAAIVTPASASS